MANKQTKTKKTTTKKPVAEKKPVEKVEAKKAAKPVAVKYDEKQIKKFKAFSKVGYITGIVSCATCVLGIIGLITGIVSIVFSAIVKNKNIDDEATARRAKKGLQMGIAGTVVGAVFCIAYAILVPWIMWKFIIW